jgi:hypothetical protein
MKNGLHTNPMLFKAAILITCFMLVMFYNKAKAHGPVPQQTVQTIP